jgi:hypothetical protein
MERAAEAAMLEERVVVPAGFGGVVWGQGDFGHEGN